VGISTIYALVRQTRLRATSGPRKSYSRNVIASLACFLTNARRALVEYQKIVEERLEHQEIAHDNNAWVGDSKPDTVGALMTPRA